MWCDDGGGGGGKVGVVRLTYTIVLSMHTRIEHHKYHLEKKDKLIKAKVQFCCFK